MPCIGKRHRRATADAEWRPPRGAGLSSCCLLIWLERFADRSCTSGDGFVVLG